MGQITVNVPDDQMAFFKKLVAQLGYGLGKVAAPAQAKAEATKRPRTQLQQDILDAYREMVEADNGTGPPLVSAEELLAELQAEEAARNSQPVQN